MEIAEIINAKKVFGRDDLPAVIKDDDLKRMAVAEHADPSGIDLTKVSLVKYTDQPLTYWLRFSTAEAKHLVNPHLGVPINAKEAVKMPLSARRQKIDDLVASISAEVKKQIAKPKRRRK